MTRRQIFLRFILKWVLVILAVGNLIALFVFDYQIPGLSRLFSSGSSEETAAAVSSSGTGRLTIEVPDGDLTYSGSGELDLTEGVKVLDENGEESDAKLTYVVYDGSSANEKRIEYSASDASGTIVTASRRLKITGQYSGPTIEIESSLPTFESSDLEMIAEVMIDRNLITAYDGLGNNITDSITAMAQPGAGSNSYIVTFTATNELGDSGTAIATIMVSDDDSEDADGSSDEDGDSDSDSSSDEDGGSDSDDSGSSSSDDEEDEDGPVIRLSTDEVTISAGSSFNALEYVTTAQDADGSDLFGNISIDGSVDTDTPGTYTLRFFVTNSAGEFSRVKTMTVYVE